MIWGTIPQSNDIKMLIVKEIDEIANITQNKIVTKNKSLLESQDREFLELKMHAIATLEAVRRYMYSLLGN